MTERARVRVTIAPATIAITAGLVAGVAVLVLPFVFQAALLAAWVIGMVTYVAIAGVRVGRARGVEDR